MSIAYEKDDVILVLLNNVEVKRNGIDWVRYLLFLFMFFFADVQTGSNWRFFDLIHNTVSQWYRQVEIQSISSRHF